MGKESKIEWTHATFNPWIGCTKVSPGCEHCYAEAQDKRWGHKRWGPLAPRTRTSKSYWDAPLRWNAEVAKSGKQFRVFCASLADVCEDRDDLLEHRADLMRLIEKTPALTWLLLTKRPQNFTRFFGVRWGDNWPKNVWAMTTAENQKQADERVPHLLRIPGVVRGLSCEPLIGPILLRETEGYWGGLGIDWVIVGGESGNGARPMHPDWARSLRDECADLCVSFHFKQWGEYGPDRGKLDVRYTPVNSGVAMDEPAPMFKIGKHAAGRILDGRTWDEFPAEKAAA